MGWVKGQSGNPAGRKEGSRSLKLKLLDQMADDAAGEMMRLMIEKARGGDFDALKWLLTYACPPRKGRAFKFTLPPLETAADSAAAIAAIAMQVSSGELSIEEGNMICDMIEQYRRAIELGEIEARLQRIESQQGR